MGELPSPDGLRLTSVKSAGLRYWGDRHQGQTSRTDIKDRHQGQTSRTDIKDRHQGQTSRTDIKDRHQGQTSRTDIKDRHQGQTSRTDIKDRHQGQTSRTDLMKLEGSTQTSFLHLVMPRRLSSDGSGDSSLDGSTGQEIEWT